MSTDPYEKILPRQLDPRKFAQKGIALSGRIEVTDLPRVAVAVIESDSEVTVDVEFGIDSERRKTLSGTAHAKLQVICQRCLEPMALELESQLALAVVWTEEQATNLPKSLDPWILEEGVADLYEIIEEELLLNLPMVSYHENACVDASAFTSGEAVIETETKPNPFQVLEQLKGSPK
jgi:uncharacterized protein